MRQWWLLLRIPLSLLLLLPHPLLFLLADLPLELSTRRGMPSCVRVGNSCSTRELQVVLLVLAKVLSVDLQARTADRQVEVLVSVE